MEVKRSLGLNTVLYNLKGSQRIRLSDLLKVSDLNPPYKLIARTNLSCSGVAPTTENLHAEGSSRIDN
jgi:hypothetical protein